MKIKKKQPNSHMCFVCGINNPFGLKSFFYELENKDILTIFKTKKEYQSYPGRVHGGIAATLLDEAIARAIIPYHDTNTMGITLHFEIKYRKPLPLESNIYIISNVNKNLSKFFEGSAKIFLKNGSVAVEAKGKYLKSELENIDTNSSKNFMWKVIPDDIDDKILEFIK